MKLTNKFTLWYFAIMLLVLLIGGAIVYYEIQWKISKVEVVRHQRLNDLIAQQIRTGGDYSGSPTRKRATIDEIPAGSMPRGANSYYTRGIGWNGRPSRHWRTSNLRLCTRCTRSFSQLGAQQPW